MLDCPDEETFVSLLQGTLDEPSRQALDDHIDRCERCSELVIGLASLTQPSPSEHHLEIVFAETPPRLMLSLKLPRPSRARRPRGWMQSLLRLLPERK